MERIRGFEVLEYYKNQVVEIMEKLIINTLPENHEPCEIQVEPENWIPRRETTYSAGYDLKSIEYASIAPGERALIGTGLTAYMENDEELQIRPRSGLAAKKGITVLNAPGTVDSDYYGKHIGVILYNTGSEEFIVKPGDRIAQGVFSKYLITDNDNPVSDSRNGGFGSTGK